MIRRTVVLKSVLDAVVKHQYVAQEYTVFAHESVSAMANMYIYVVAHQCAAEKRHTRLQRASGFCMLFVSLSL